MTMLADQFDAVIGVDTHQDTHTAAVVDTVTGAVLDDTRDEGSPQGSRVLRSRGVRRGHLAAVGGTEVVLETDAALLGLGPSLLTG
ncbi:MAG: hypothetical protein WBA45_01920 [Microthrixaceae bacterium]